MIAQHASLLWLLKLLRFEAQLLWTRIMRPVTIARVCRRPSHGDGGPGSNNDWRQGHASDPNLGNSLAGPGWQGRATAALRPGSLSPASRRGSADN